MSEKRQKANRPAVLFGQKNVKKVGYIDDYIFACEIEGEAMAPVSSFSEK